MNSKLSSIIVFSLLLFSHGPLAAAPLFPDVSEEHWAGDAVRSLAAKGLVEGYPDGTFKGDRAASRWELAMVVARLLQRLESEQTAFFSKTELEELRGLAEALREELDSLGIRTENLEERTSLLERRVGELERLTFYGEVNTRVLFQSFSNDGAVDNDAGRLGAGLPGTVPYINYNAVVGTGPPALWRPQQVGVFPMVNYGLGKALTNGTGFTSLAILGLNIDVSPSIDAGAEFAAFSSQGDLFVDAFWGVSAPYQQNVFSANAGAGQSNTPFTRMAFDHFWLHHKPSSTKLVLGNIESTNMDPLIYTGQGNLGVFGPRRWPGYGFDLSGETELGKEQNIRWEVLGSRFGNAIGADSLNYLNYTLSGNLNYNFARGGVGFEFSRMAEDGTPNSQGLPVGLTVGPNLAYGADGRWSVRQWVNPPGHFANQRSSLEQLQTISVPNLVDTRPISGWHPNLDNATGYGPGAGAFGPQSQNVWGLKANYDIPLSETNKIALKGNFGRSAYKANRNSPFISNGNALVFEADAYLLDGNFDLGASYLRIDPNYSAAFWPGNILGQRPVKSFNFTGVFHLFDSGKYPHNREGFRLRTKWHFDEKRGKLWARGSVLRQTQTSLYDVRVTNGALGNLIPTQDVVGFSPGFTDTIFAGFAHPNIYGPASGNSFAANLAPLENPRGKESFGEVGGSYRWEEAGLTFSGVLSRNKLRRDSSLSPAQGGSQNRVDMTIDSVSLALDYDLNEKLTLRSGFDYVGAAGHFDPAGLYNGYARDTGSIDFENLDSYQVIPSLGFDYDLNDTTAWNVLARYYATKDRVDESIQTGNPALGQIGSTTHPFVWDGWQVSSEFRLTF